MKALTVLLTIIISYTAQSQPLSPACNEILKNLKPGWSYNKVTVPLSKEDDTETIDVYFYFRDQNLYGNKTPILFLNGGPTLSGAKAMPLFDHIKKMSDQNIILMDQRGTGCSGHFPPDHPSTKKNNLDYNEYINFTSESILRDAEFIRENFFKVHKWKIYGQSFGAFLSFRYIEMFPGSISSAHIHGFGIPSKPNLFMLQRELRLNEVSKKFLSYNKDDPSLPTILSIVEKIKSHKEEFNKVCVDTPYSLKKNFCGEDLFSGLFLVLGFHNAWPIIYDTLREIAQNLESGNLSNLETLFKNFAEDKILKFQDRDQIAALNFITYYELVPGFTFYSGCYGVKENDIFSECRNNKNFIIPMNKQPDIDPRPLNIELIKNNIKKYNLSVFYYAGQWDNFVPLSLVYETSKALGIENSTTIFANSGHDGYYSEELVINNLIQ